MKLFKKATKTKTPILDFEQSDEMFNYFHEFQNEINSQYKTEKIAITSISNDKLAFRFALMFAKSYANYKSRTLVIDANLYSFSFEKAKKNSRDLITKIDGVDCYRLNDSDYPGDVFRGGELEKIVKKYKKDYDHFVVLMPDISKYKEIGLMNGFFDCSILLTRRNQTKNRDIFNAVEFFKEKQLNLAKIIILK